MKNEGICAFLLVFSVLILLAVPLGAILPSGEECAIYDGILRLHVIAESDSDEDQALKLYVRDRMIGQIASLTEDCTSVREAYYAIAAKLDELEAYALDALAVKGSDCTVKVSLGREYFPTRVYRGVTLPSGEYDSLCVRIGKAQGANWWCVLFPQLCLVSASADSYENTRVGIADQLEIDDSDELFIEAGLTRSQIELITGDSPRVTVKLRILEWLSELTRRVKS